MKKIFTALFLVSMTSMSIACPLSNLSLGDFFENGSNPVTFPGKLFFQFPELESFEHEFCQDSIRETEVQDKNGKKIKAIYTYEDGCDGGNSYGVLLDDKTLTPVGVILDGDFYCRGQ